MPKIKTNRSAAKRFFKVSSSGKVKRAKAFRNHILTKKSATRKRNFSQPSYVHDSDMKRVSKLLNI